MSLWNSVELDTVGMVWGIAGIAEKENFFLICLSTYWTGATFLLVFNFVVNPSTWVEIGDLFPVFDCIF
jgi:hypothetical protein